MADSIDQIVARLDLAPHPFEGWFRQTAHLPGQSRTFLLLITARTHVPWHRLPAHIHWTLKEGDRVVISHSMDGQQAEGTRLNLEDDPALLVPSKTYQTLECLGRWSLLEGRLGPDIPITERLHCPENWFPGQR